MNHMEYRARRRRDPEYAKVEARLKPLLALANDVLRLRLERGWTQAQLAKRVGTRQANISRLESGLGNPTFDFLLRVSSTLGAELVVRPVAQGEAQVQALGDLTLRSDIVPREAEGTESIEVGMQSEQWYLVHFDRSTQANPAVP